MPGKRNSCLLGLFAAHAVATALKRELNFALEVKEGAAAAAACLNLESHPPQHILKRN